MGRELRRACVQLEQLAARIRTDLNMQAHDTAPRIAALYMFAKAWKSYQAGKLLFKSGFWQDATTIGRTVLELGFQTRWLNLDLPNRAELLIRHELRDRRKLLQGLKISASIDFRDKAAVSLVELDKVLQATGADQAWRNWWSEDGNVPKLAEDMGLAPVYDILYRQLCWFVHSSPFGAAYYLREDGDRTAYDCRPAPPAVKDRGFVEILFTSLPIGLNEALAVADSAYNLQRQPEFDDIKRTMDAHVQEMTTSRPHQSPDVG